MDFQTLWDMTFTTPLVPAAILGVAWGIVGGALPGISPSITMALLLPFTYGMHSSSAVVLLASTYFGAEYGGSIPAILIRTPGTNAAAATVIDGYAMKQQGKAGEALGISLYSGVIGGTFGLIMLVLLTEPLSRIALAFKPSSYFALGMLGLSVIGSLAGESLIKGLIAAVLGLMIAAIGTDPVTGLNRFTFGSPELLSGIAPILVLVGLYAVSELMTSASEPPWEKADAGTARLKFPSPATWKRIWPAQAIGAVVGLIEGCTPGGGGTVAAFLSYNEARRWSRRKEEFGHGSPEGIAAPETANTAVSKTALIPMLSRFNNITVMTNSLHIVNALSEFDSEQTILMPGGTFRKKSASFHGQLAENAFEHFSFDKLFMGTDGIDLNAGVTTFNEVFSVSKAMCNAAREVILMADSSKFGRKSPNIVCSLESVDKLITDAGIDPAFKKALEEKGIDVIVTGERDE